MSYSAELPILIALLLGIGASANASGPQPEQLWKKLATVIHKFSPKAEIKTTGETFAAKQGTMVFTIHGHSMTGEISPQTYKEEGPNYKGFVLSVSLEKGRYNGQAVVPQEVSGPYYPTFLDAVPTRDGAHYYSIQFSYGSRLDPKLKKAIFEALGEKAPDSHTRFSAP